MEKNINKTEVSLGGKSSDDVDMDTQEIVKVGSSLSKVGRTALFSPRALVPLNGSSVSWSVEVRVPAII